MKKNAFTLIELLAVIVILAIIVLIATPIILGIIKDAKEEANHRSIDNYADSIKQSIMKAQLNDEKVLTGYYIITNNKLMNIEDENFYIDVNYEGKKVECDIIKYNKDGTIYLGKCKVNGTYVDYTYGKLQNILMPSSGGSEVNFLSTNIERKKILTLTLQDSINIPSGYSSSDCSQNQDKSVMCWWNEDQKTPGYYNLYIGGIGGVAAPEDSSFLFSDVGYEKMKELDLNILDTSDVTNMKYMFDYTGRSYMKSLDLGKNFDTINVKDMSWMFYQMGYNELSTINLGDKFDTRNVEYMDSMFRMMGWRYLTNLDLGNKFDTSNVKNMKYMFEMTGSNMLNLNLGNKFDTSNVENMVGMFEMTGYKKLKKLDLGNKFNTSKVTDMQSMFSNVGYNALTSLNLGDKFDTSNVKNMSGMFAHAGNNNVCSNCSSKLEYLNLGDKFDTSKVTETQHMFAGLTSLKELNLGNKFDTSNVNNMYNMFGNLTNLTNLNLGNFGVNLNSRVSYNKLFNECGQEGILINVEVDNLEVKNWIINNSDANNVPEFWNNNIIKY